MKRYMVKNFKKDIFKGALVALTAQYITDWLNNYITINDFVLWLIVVLCIMLIDYRCK